METNSELNFYYLKSLTRAKMHLLMRKRMLESSFDHFGESAEKGIFDKSFTILGFFMLFVSVGLDL